jgi:guanosine-3',5'-bis(diphosphate) 3'-pyrophosphohydrolase
MLATPMPMPEPVLNLRDLLNTYLEPEKVAIILRAFDVGAAAHEGQTRKTGEPYILHPVAVARILANMRMDYASVAAAILHDTIEDTPLTRTEIESRFGDEIAELVDGVTKLDKMKFRTRHEADAESFRKLLLAMSKDLRVIFIKLADRLHNMRTLSSMTAAPRRRIARETLDIYAPIADRLGMNSIKSELQDLGFENLYPWRHRTIAEHISTVTGDRSAIIADIYNSLKRKMSEAGIPCDIKGREKTPYSIYRKMQAKDLSFSEVMDVYAFRVITHSEPHCYLALGAIHSLYPPKPGRFKDYIALPKPNGYRSLHTVLNSPFELPVEIQIRTREMDIMAEKGAAAHWQYKSGEPSVGSAEVRAKDWLMQLVEVQRHSSDSMEFLDNAKSDLFPDQIFVFTPKGKIIDMRRNATALDFAYAIHTDVGNHAAHILVDKVEVPFSNRLANGQTVEVITDEAAHPMPEWLDFVTTARARTAIRQFIKSLEQADTVALGLRLLETTLNNRGSSIDDVPAKRMDRFLRENHFERQEDLYTALAMGNLLASIVAVKLAPEVSTDASAESAQALIIAGSEGSAVTFSACCHPVPGDAIMGYLSAGKGVVIHRTNCRNVRELRKHPDHCIEVKWASIRRGMFEVALNILAKNVPGVLANISASIGDAGSNIEKVEQPEANPEAANLLFTISVADRDHMARVMRRLRRNRNVIRVSRIGT